MNAKVPTDAERDRVRALLGREPRGNYSVVVRDAVGDPVVLQNAPLLDDGTPMPTRFWLVGPDEQRRIGQLESLGGVNAAEAAIDPAELADAHQRYAAERDREIPDGHTGPVPTGGVGGTRVGVKCLHAHWAWYLAGGDDPVGVWIATQLGDETVAGAGDQRRPSHAVPSQPTGVATGPDRFAIGRATTAVTHTVDGSTVTSTLPWGAANLTARWLAESDPPAAADLTNALGAVDDELDDLVRAKPDWAPSTDTVFEGPGVTALVGLELGGTDLPASIPIDRSTVEELFRLTATSTVRERADNPGLPSDHADDIVAVCCIVLAVMRRFQLARAVFATSSAAATSEADP